MDSEYDFRFNLMLGCCHCGSGWANEHGKGHMVRGSCRNLPRWKRVATTFSYAPSRLLGIILIRSSPFWCSSCSYSSYCRPQNSGYNHQDCTRGLAAVSWFTGPRLPPLPISWKSNINMNEEKLWIGRKTYWNVEKRSQFYLSALLNSQWT